MVSWDPSCFATDGTNHAHRFANHGVGLHGVLFRVAHATADAVAAQEHIDRFDAGNRSETSFRVNSGRLEHEQNMEWLMSTFVLTYAIVWLVLILYVANLGITQRRLMRTAAALQFQRTTQERFPR